ncbi:MAG: O-methyltransferase [Opitutales bacterium]
MGNDLKFTPLNADLAAYVDRHRSDREDSLLTRLRAETREALADRSGMQIPADQGTFFSILTAAMEVRTAVEVGTFTGYSALCIARALAPGGHLHCFDVSDTYTAIARRYWAEAGVGDRITLHLGDARELLDKHAPQEIDLAFVDADKAAYPAYADLLIPRMRPNGLLLFDNVLWHGKITDPGADDPDTLALRALNETLTTDPRLEASILTVGDGILMARKR